VVESCNARDVQCSERDPSEYVGTEVWLRVRIRHEHMLCEDIA
jgi:hypothetical protein